MPKVKKTPPPRYGGFKVTVNRAWTGVINEIGDIDDPQLLSRLSRKGTRVVVVGN